MAAAKGKADKRRTRWISRASPARVAPKTVHRSKLGKVHPIRPAATTTSRAAARVRRAKAPAIESGGSETESSGDPATTDAAPADSDPGTTDIAAGASSSADTPAAVEPGRDADQGQTGLPRTACRQMTPPTILVALRGSMLTNCLEGARVIATRQSPEEPGQDLPVALATCR